jgi:hypothetical protein
METKGVSTAGKVRSAGGKPLRVAPRRKSGRAAFIRGFWFAAAGTVVAGAIGVWVAFKPTASRFENVVSASTADSHRLATIVREDGDVRCVRGTFDNVTGSIAQNKMSCDMAPIHVTGDAAPQPLGTIHTLSAISNSFKK